MNEFLGNEVSNHIALIIFTGLAVCSFISMICGEIMINYFDKRARYDLSIIGHYIAIFGGIGVIVFTVLGGCFK